MGKPVIAACCFPIFMSQQHFHRQKKFQMAAPMAHILHEVPPPARPHLGGGGGGMNRGWCWWGGVLKLKLEANGQAHRSTSGRFDGLPCDIAHWPA